MKGTGGKCTKGMEGNRDGEVATVRMRGTKTERNGAETRPRKPSILNGSVEIVTLDTVADYQ